jgi:hypothetical protein
VAVTAIGAVRPTFAKKSGRAAARERRTMMAKSATFKVPNGIVFVTDARGGDTPDFDEEKLVMSTKSCVAICCQHEIDGETGFTLGLTQEVDPGDQPAFEGMLETPDHMITVRSSHNEIMLQAPVGTDETKIRIWANDPSSPDQVIIGIG